MKGRPERLAEAFMILWEQGYKVREVLDRPMQGRNVVNEIPNELLLAIGWNPAELAINEEDRRFLEEYYKFIEVIY